MNTEFRARLELGESMKCWTCGRHAQVYRRRIYGTVAMQLIRLYKLGGMEKYIHTRHLVGPRATGVGDFSKAKYWGLIEEAPDTTDNRNSGYWRLTAKGFDFVQRNTMIMEYAHVYDDEVLKFDGKLITIKDCLGERFDYDQLMSQT